MLFLGSFLDAPLTRSLIDSLIFWQEKGTYLSQVLSMSDLQFSSFQVSNVFVAAERSILGCFLVVFWP